MSRVVKIIVTAATAITLCEPAVSKLNMSVASLSKSLPCLQSLNALHRHLFSLVPCTILLKLRNLPALKSLCFKMDGLITNVSSRVNVVRRVDAGCSTSLLLKLVAAGE